jgi:hypothetical protein
MEDVIAPAARKYYLEQLLLLGNFTWISSCSWRRLLRSRAPALKEGSMERLMLCKKITWNSSCSWVKVP